MKKPAVNYLEFRFSRIREPRFSHIPLLLGWVAYFALYFITENLIPAEICHPMHCRLDDLIPFCEYFAIFYVFWYFLVFGSLLYFFLYDTEKFRKLQTFIMITQLVAMICYIVYPSRQDLRPETFLRDNVFTRLMAGIYSFDTNTGVCPSLHVAYSMGVVSVFLKDRDASRLWKWFVVTVSICICLATAFVKQHSMVDVFAALVLCLFTELLVYGKSYWYPRLRQHARLSE